MKRRILLQTTVVLMFMGSGLALGLWVASVGTGNADLHDAPDRPPALGGEHELLEAAGEHDDEELHVHLTKQALENLQLRTGTVKLEDYQRRIRIPGQVVEIPGQSRRSVAAPVTGIVDRIDVEEGQVVRPESVIMELEITDEQLLSGQVALLDVVNQLSVTQTELDRLTPLAESGTIAGRRKLELEYERQQLQARLKARTQELKARGLTPDQVAGVREDGELVQRVTVHLPRAAGSARHRWAASNQNSHAGTLSRPVSSSNGSAVSTGTAADEVYTVERLNVHPGMSITRGDELCLLADHRWLYIRGEAFEQDIESLTQLKRRGWTVTAEFGHQHEQAHQHLKRLEGLEVAYVDNHVDPQTRTFRFYLRLKNEVEQEHPNTSGAIFREWRYKPGQLAHLFVPVARWQQQIKLPLAAVVEEGPDVFVFRRHEEPFTRETPRARSGPRPHTEEPYAEFEPVAVHLLHRDEQYAIVADDGQLQPGDEVALNQAYQLQLATKMQAGEGAHHHHHDH